MLNSLERPKNSSHNKMAGFPFLYPKIFMAKFILWNFLRFKLI